MICWLSSEDKSAETRNQFFHLLILRTTLDNKAARIFVRWTTLGTMRNNFRPFQYQQNMLADYLNNRHWGLRVKRTDIWGSTELHFVTWWLEHFFLLIKIPKGMILICFANGVAVTITVRNVNVSQMRQNHAMRRITACHLELGNEAVQAKEGLRTPISRNGFDKHLKKWQRFQKCWFE